MRHDAVLDHFARIDRILAVLPPDDAAYLSGLFEPKWKQRERRLAARDDAIRRVLAMLADQPNPAARLAEAMARQTTQRGGMTGDHLIVEAVGTALAANDGAPMTERQIRNVAAGDRTPRK